MKKNGFTLAEVLITLAIVGLIASLTLPGLNSNISNRRIGPALAKAINNLLFIKSPLVIFIIKKKGNT